MPGTFRAGFAIGVLLFAATAAAGQHEAFLAVTASEDPYRFDGLHQEIVQVGYGDLHRPVGWEPNYVYAATGLMRRASFTASRYSIGVGWRYHLSDAPRWFLDIGIAPTYLTRYNFPDDDTYQDLGSRFHFATHFGIGWASAARYGFIVQLEHLSNGGLHDLNPGTNQVGVTVFVEL